MPIYEFLCDKCNTKFDEYFKSSTEKKKLFCPSCNGRRVHKIFSLFGTSTGGGGGSSSGSSSGDCGSCTASTCTGCS